MGGPEIEGLYFQIQSPFPGSQLAAVSAALTAQCSPLRLRPPCPSRSFGAPTTEFPSILSQARPRIPYCPNNRTMLFNVLRGC
jgi:hypothetical protein